MNSHCHYANLVVVLPFRRLLAPLAPQDDAINGVLESPFKRRRLADDPNPPWLEEVRSKVWNKKEPEPEHFPKCGGHSSALCRAAKVPEGPSLGS